MEGGDDIFIDQIKVFGCHSTQYYCQCNCCLQEVHARIIIAWLPPFPVSIVTKFWCTVSIHLHLIFIDTFNICF